MAGTLLAVFSQLVKFLEGFLDSESDPAKLGKEKDIDDEFEVDMGYTKMSVAPYRSSADVDKLLVAHHEQQSKLDMLVALMTKSAAAPQPRSIVRADANHD